MRIGIDCRSLQEPQSAGVSVYTRQLLRTLLDLPEAHGHEFVAFVNAANLVTRGEERARVQRGLESPLLEWRVRSVPNKLVTALQIVESRPSFAWMFGSVDVAFFPNMIFLPLVRQPTPFVLTVHDLSFERYPECFSAKGRLWHQLIKPEVLTHMADQVIAVSEHTKHDLEELYGVPPNRISVIHPGVLPAPEPIAIEVPEQYLLSLATLEPRKNLETLLDAFDLLRADHPRLKLVLVGGAGWRAPALQARIEGDPRIDYRGYVDEPTKHALLASAAVFVYPSLYEGFGFPPLEAQAAGVPVVVGAHSSLPEVVGDSALLIDVLDARAMARAIHHALTDQVLRAGLITAGKKNVERFQWEAAARSTLQILISVAEQHPARYTGVL